MNQRVVKHLAVRWAQFRHVRTACNRVIPASASTVARPQVTCDKCLAVIRCGCDKKGLSPRCRSPGGCDPKERSSRGQGDQEIGGGR